MQRGRSFADTSNRARHAIAEQGARFIRGGHTVLVHGHSRVVLTILRKAASLVSCGSAMSPISDSECSGFFLVVLHGAVLSEVVVPDTDHDDGQSAGARADAPAQSGLPGGLGLRCPRSKIKTVGAVVWFLMHGAAVPGAVVQPTERSEVQTACAWPLSCDACYSAQSCLLANPSQRGGRAPRDC